MKARTGFLAIAGVAVAGVSALMAVDRTWDGGGGDSQWGTAANWSSDTMPGTSDRAILTTNVVGTIPQRILLGADRTVNELRYSSSGDLVLDGEGLYTLRINNGSISGTGYPTPTIKSVIACDVILGATGTWTPPENWGSVVAAYGRVSDGGNGYSVTFGGNQNMNVVIGGAWDIGGTLSILHNSTRIGGVYTNASEVAQYGGSITNATGVYVDGRMGSADQSETTLTIENLYQADSDRIRGATVLGVRRTGGALTFNGHAADPVAERVAMLDLQSGRLNVIVAGRTASVGTDLIVDSVRRASGASLLVATNTGARLIVEGAVNTNGTWQPWCFFGPYYSKVGPANTLSSTFSADYLTPAETGSDPTKLYRFTSASLALGENSSMWGLKWDSSSAQTLDLGPYDLTLGSGAMIVYGNSNKRIVSSGGRLVFGGEDVVYYVDGSASFTNSAPVAWSKPAGSSNACPSLVFARGNRTDGITLDGEDRIGTYSNLYCYAYISSARRTLTFAGPSDRTFRGTVNGVFNLEKRGAGTLTLACANERRSGVFNVYEGRVVLAHATPPAPTVNDGAECAVAEGVSVNTGGGYTITVLTNGTLRGLGTTGSVTLRAGARVAPGHADTVGTLSTGTHTYLPTNLVLAVRLSATTNDMLKVTGNLTLPPTDVRLNLEVSDASRGTVWVKGKSYTVATWTGTDPATDPTWTVTTATPALLDVSGATVTVDKTANRIVVSGLKPKLRGTLISVL